ncbi:MAG TPA: adenylate/guanylate cyclase domain-containing protein, partial [Polymorphobacter sp.]|nr:adenylate/guanylate cyclase domain-containing protein [Polymorphobacter sp.]
MAALNLFQESERDHEVRLCQKAWEIFSIAGATVDDLVKTVRNGGGRSTGKRAYVTVFFCDLCGSTSLMAEVDGESYIEMLEQLRSACTRVVTRFGGNIAQLYGDGTLALFPGANGVERAVDAALALNDAVKLLSVPRGASARSLQLHSGIHSGLVQLRPGDPARGTIEAVGRTTAVAARLSAAARPNEILVSSGSLGPVRDVLTVGPARHVDISDGADPIAA